MRRLLAVVLLALAAVPAAAQGAERVLLERARPTQLKAYAGIALFSRWDGTAYRLVVSRAAGRPQELPLPPQAAAFDADIGPDAARRPTVVFSRCDAGTMRRSGGGAARRDAIGRRGGAACGAPLGCGGRSAAEDG